VRLHSVRLYSVQCTLVQCTVYACTVCACTVYACTVYSVRLYSVRLYSAVSHCECTTRACALYTSMLQYTSTMLDSLCAHCTLVPCTLVPCMLVYCMLSRFCTLYTGCITSQSTRLDIPACTWIALPHRLSWPAPQPAPPCQPQDVLASNAIHACTLGHCKCPTAMAPDETHHESTAAVCSFEF
jgi:hypothetical protein